MVNTACYFSGSLDFVKDNITILLEISCIMFYTVSIYESNSSKFGRILFNQEAGKCPAVTFIVLFPIACCPYLSVFFTVTVSALLIFFTIINKILPQGVNGQHL